MWVEQLVKECDFTGKEYDTPQQGAGAICRGATGRYCVVMHAGPEYIADNTITVKTPEECDAIIRKAGDGYPDY